MRTIPTRLVSVSVVLVLLLGAAALSGPPHRTNADEPGVVSFQMETPPEVSAAVARLSGKRPPQRALSGPLQGEVTLVDEGFDGEDFPPAGWEYGISGVPDTPDFQWSRETCKVDSRIPGNVAAAWSVGGGTGGDALPCGSPYTQPVEAFLLTGPYDGSNLAGGVHFEWLTNHNVPADRGNNFPYGVCVLLSSNSSCIVPRDASSGGSWGLLRGDPIVEAAGLQELWFYLLYRDRTPTGAHTGAFVDELKVIGHEGAPSPTATDVPAPPTPPGQSRVNLPITMMKASKGDLPAVDPVPPGAMAAFGTGLTGNIENNVVMNAQLVNSGSVFQVGHEHLCTRVSWAGQAPGTMVNWRWFLNGDPVAEGNPNVNPTIQAPDANGSAGNCLYRPPEGQYQVRTFLNGTASGMASAVIQANPPPGATAVPVPTEHPTVAPSPTPVETPGTDSCRNTLVNGDFERGPSVAWRLGMDPVIAGRTIGDVIGNFATTSGTFSARLGEILFSGRDFIEEINQESSPTGLIDASRMISATLRFRLLLLTNETRDGVHNDRLYIGFASRQNPDLFEGVGQTSEEVATASQWGAYEEDVTAAMTRRAEWDSSYLVFQSQTDDTDGSNFIIDDVELEVCRTTGAIDAWPPAQKPSGDRDAGTHRLPVPVPNDEDIPVLRPVRHEPPVDAAQQQPHVRRVTAPGR